jgi:hypothetical protein
MRWNESRHRNRFGSGRRHGPRRDDRSSDNRSSRMRSCSRWRSRKRSCGARSSSKRSSRGRCACHRRLDAWTRYGSHEFRRNRSRGRGRSAPSLAPPRRRIKLPSSHQRFRPPVQRHSRYHLRPVARAHQDSPHLPTPEFRARSLQRIFAGLQLVKAVPAVRRRHRARLGASPQVAHHHRRPNHRPRVQIRQFAIERASFLGMRQDPQRRQPHYRQRHSHPGPSRPVTGDPPPHLHGLAHNPAFVRTRSPAGPAMGTVR